MQTANKTAITVEVLVNAPVEKVWDFMTAPKHITQWCYASDEWHAPYAENDVQVNGKFKTRMAAKDGSMGFDFEGVYTNVKKNELIEYKLGDDRKVVIHFSAMGNQTRVLETFDPENENPEEMQRGGWQAILNNFKHYVETSN